MLILCRVPARSIALLPDVRRLSLSMCMRNLCLYLRHRLCLRLGLHPSSVLRDKQLLWVGRVPRLWRNKRLSWLLNNYLLWLLCLLLLLPLGRMVRMCVRVGKVKLRGRHRSRRRRWTIRRAGRRRKVRVRQRFCGGDPLAGVKLQQSLK